MCNPAHDCPICAPAAAIWAAAQAAANEPGTCQICGTPGITWADPHACIELRRPPRSWAEDEAEAQAMERAENAAEDAKWASDADMDRAADYHYRNETTPSWDYGRTSA